MVEISNKDMLMCVISHTHWDREWYYSWEEFRFRLVYTIDKLLRILDSDKRFANFTLDGQSVVLEDYLEIRPHNRDKIARYLKEGRITAGPFYMLPDEFMVSPESHVRNLLLGKQIVESFGAKPMPVGNLPDEFGHIAQMPQILQGFNIDNMIFTRGMGDEANTLNSEFEWIAPDGKTSVLAINQPMGYGNMAGATRDKPNFESPTTQAKHVRDTLKKRAATNVLLLMSGVDHLSPEEKLPDFIEYFNKLGTEGTMRHTTFMGYLEALHAALKNTKLKSFTGGLQGGKDHLLLSDIITSRVYLLQENLKNEALLERWAEPLSAIVELVTKKQFEYPKDYLWYAWRWLLKNQPHDSIGGCSVDEVHRDMMNRFAHAYQVGTTLLKDAVRHLIPRINFYPGKKEPKEARDMFEFLVFNPSPFKRSSAINLLVETADLGEPTCPEAFRIVDSDGKTTPAENWRVPDISAVFAKWKPNDAYYQYEFVVSDVPALGFKVYYMMAVEDEPAKADTSWAKVIKGKAAKIENQLLAVTINANGTFDLLDKQSGLTYKDCCSFIDEPDYGDEYDFVRMPENHVIHQSRQAKADVKEIVVRGSRVMATVSVPFTIPDALNPDRKAQSAKKIDLLIELTITLNDNSRRVDVKIVVNNKAKDHRLRVAVPSGIATDSKLFQQHFCVLKKSLKIPEGKNWTQKPAPTEFHDHFFGVAGTRDGKEAGLVVISRDAQQHEVNEKDFGINSLILTLYRAVGWLGRPGQGAGPDVPTPDAQCLFPMEFNMAILPFEPCKTGKAQFCIPDEVFSNIEQFVNPLLPVVLRTFNDFRNTDPLPALLDYKRIDMPKITLVDEHNEEFLKQEKLVDPVAGFISIEPSCLLFSSFKKADAGDGYILRFYNLCRDDRDATIKVHPALGLAKAEEVKLDEITLVKKHEVSFSKNTAVVKKIGHDEIVTLKFKT